eukprot:COSAG04_NODE_2885_length_3423_cov_2.741340_6_plen_44_part_00
MCLSWWSPGRSGVANSGFGGAAQVGGAPLRKFRMQISEWVESE